MRTNLKDIRRHLPADLAAQFQDDLDEAVDSGNIAEINHAKASHRARALLETDPLLVADLHAHSLGELAFFPSPLSR